MNCYSTIVSRPVWLCPQCNVYYENCYIEGKLTDEVQRKVMSYIIQDVRCDRCKQTKMENLSMRCECVGNFQTMVKREEVLKQFGVIETVARLHQMVVLEEQLKWISLNA